MLEALMLGSFAVLAGIGYWFKQLGNNPDHRLLGPMLMLGMFFGAVFFAALVLWVVFNPARFIVGH